MELMTKDGLFCQNDLFNDTMNLEADAMPLLGKLIIVFAVVALYFMGGYAFYFKLFRITAKSKNGVVDHTSPFFAPAWNWFTNAPKDDVKIRGYDGTLLHATYLPNNDKDSMNLAIVCHGYHATGTDMAIITKLYSDLGFKVLVIDQRGHGESSGNFTSLGYHESYDLRKWIIYALRIYGATDKILLHGVSMGTAAILLAAARGIPDNVKLLVLDSPYTSFYRTLSRVIRPKLLLFFLPALSLITYFNLRFFPEQIHSLRAAAKSSIPMVAIVGDMDHSTAPSMAKELIATSHGIYKDLLIVKGATHTQSYVVDKAGYEAFLSPHLQKHFDLKRPKSK